MENDRKFKGNKGERFYESFEDLLQTVEKPRKLNEIEMNIAKCFWDQAVRTMKNTIKLTKKQK